MDSADVSGIICQCGNITEVNVYQFKIDMNVCYRRFFLKL